MSKSGSKKTIVYKNVWGKETLWLYGNNKYDTFFSVIVTHLPPYI